MRIRTMISVATIGALAASATAATPQEVIKARQGNFKSMGKAMKAIGDEIRKPAPDLAVVRPNAAQLLRFSRELPRWFPARTGPEAGIKTEAKAEIWTRPAEFRTAAVNFNRAATALNAAATRGDAAAIAGAARAVGGTCKGCHDSFRAKTD